MPKKNPILEAELDRLPAGAKARVCQQRDLSKEHFIKLIERRIEDSEAWERTLRSQGKLKDAERMRKAKG